MKFLLFLSPFFALSLSTATAKEEHTVEEMMAAVEANNHPPKVRSAEQKHHERVLNDMVSETMPEPEPEEEEEGDKGQSMGERCGNRLKCKEGLDCTATGMGLGLVKVCLPMACIKNVVEAYNEANTDGVTLFDQFTQQVLQGAHQILPDIPADGTITPQSEVWLNQTTVGLGFTGASSKNNFEYVMRTDVKDALELSLAETQKKDPLNIEELSAQAQACFTGEAYTPGDQNERRLEDDEIPTTFTMPGFYLELGALFQFTYGLGIANNIDNNGTDVTVHDICFGAGPMVGGGLGFLLQFWFLPTSVRDEAALPEEYQVVRNALLRGDASGLQGKEAVFLPIPLLMIDLDAGLGPHLGIAYNTLAFLCNRLWLKFGIGAGGGLAVSLCFVGLDGEDLLGSRKLIGGDDRANRLLSAQAEEST